ncbi:MAG TPA: hypothetical protein VFA53_06490 [Xanthobacteraceae bacterium]|nr:hypothetical protein [Xanthobacteraceae bacterium]
MEKQDIAGAIETRARGRVRPGRREDNARGAHQSGDDDGGAHHVARFNAIVEGAELGTNILSQNSE